jgi:hypothetical protein
MAQAGLAGASLSGGEDVGHALVYLRELLRQLVDDARHVRSPSCRQLCR